MLRIGVELRGLRLVDRILAKLSERSGDMSPLFRGAIDKYATSIFRRQFATQGRFGGTPWPPLSASTRQQKAKKRRAGMGILRETNRLWGSLVKSGGPEGIRVIEPLRYVRGTRVPYAAAHQKGVRPKSWAPGGRGKRLPARQLVPDPLPAEVVRTIEKLVTDYIIEGK